MKTQIQKKSVRVFGVKFEADDLGSGTWDHVEENGSSHEQVRSVDDFVDDKLHMNAIRKRIAVKRKKFPMENNIKTISSSTEKCRGRSTFLIEPIMGRFYYYDRYFSVILWLSFIYPVSILMLSETIISLHANPQKSRVLWILVDTIYAILQL